MGPVFSLIGGEGGRPHVAHPVGEYNFAGVYRRTFDLDEREASVGHVISFLGVASCLDLYLNGRRVGYAEGSHNTAEFDIAPCQRAGTNELVAVVRRWCTGSYLECQDMFRNNGIFRDVLLRERSPPPESGTWACARAEKNGRAACVTTWPLTCASLPRARCA